MSTLKHFYISYKMKIIIDCRKIGTFSDIEINDNLPLLQQIISYLDSLSIDTSQALVVYGGKQINPELTILNLPGLSNTPKFLVSKRTVRNNGPNVMPQAPPLYESQPNPEPQPQIAVNSNHEKIANSDLESDGEEKPIPNSSKKCSAAQDKSLNIAQVKNASCAQKKSASTMQENSPSSAQEKSPNNIQDDTNWDWKLAQLMEEGYEFEDAYKALQEYDGNLEESRKYLKELHVPEDVPEEPPSSTNDDATILDNLLKSKDPTIVDLRAKIRNDPGYIWQWIENLKEQGQKVWIDFFERNAYIIVDAIFDSPEEVTPKPPNKPLLKENKPPPAESKPLKKLDGIESDSDMSDVSFDSNDSELNEI
ncbi:unnamed protein product [Blepharisma stoltei]|uniref:UBA domain-containing protein n=1 Tax=Blepharisma stoltei TaxID=1481888 RepID=A0AAU9JGZ2_9CILI|nr:unnamed protein product [Blepharisma stoltei]